VNYKTLKGKMNDTFSLKTLQKCVHITVNLLSIYSFSQSFLMTEFNMSSDRGHGDTIIISGACLLR
jgi:hypothetical protein